MTANIYYDSHRALALGQTGLLGGAIGTAISSVASSALAVGFTNVWLMGTGARGIGVMVAFFLAGEAGLIQGGVRYPVHYYLDGKLDTTAKKIMGLALEFLASTFVLWLSAIGTFYHPFHAALFYSAISFPISIAACTILGMTFICIGNLYQNRAIPLPS